MKQSKKKRVTLQDVAKHAGVSRATASLIVRNSPKIAPETRKKVLKSMEELGYVYDRVAAKFTVEKFNNNWNHHYRYIKHILFGFTERCPSFIRRDRLYSAVRGNF